MNANQRIIFVNNLSRYMEIRGVTQSDIVSSIGVSASTVSDWVKGKKYPRVDVMQLLADYLGVLISDLTTEHPSISSTNDDSEESDLIKMFRCLNPKGRADLLKYARYLNADPDMTEDGASSSTTA